MPKLLVVILLIFAACGAGAAEPRLLPQELLDEGWISLFDGETTFGWQPVGEAKWEVVDGEIRTKGEKAGFLMTTTQWANYELHVEFKAPAATNSGIFLRTATQPTSPSKDCVELNIAPRDNPYPTGSFVNRWKISTQPGVVLRGNSLQGFKSDEPRNEIDAWDGNWHAFDLTITGDHAKLWLDGAPLDTVDLNHEAVTPAVGRIALQSREGLVAFRNIRLRPSDLTPIMNGKDLAGWSLDRAEMSKFDVTPDHELHLTNGPGQIETTKDFQNFALQAECKVNGEGLNSGIFFRTLRTGRWVGYESQINNVFKDGDRTKPKDFGTGAIYRRQPARRVVPNDHEWFTKTIVADGPHMAVWVNGYQVTDWTDQRPAKESAREGRRDGGGAIAIQGHDPTTDFLFRKIRAVELPR